MTNELENNLITVVLADDHAVVRRGLLAFFETTEAITVVEIASNAAEAVAAVAKHKPQVLLLDLLLPDQSAPATIQQVKAASPMTQIVMLTSHEGTEHVGEVMEAGALSYVLKDISPADLIDVLQKAAVGETLLNERLAQEITRSASQLHNALTEREHEVVCLIAKGHSNAEIAGQLCISETTVKSHVSSILGKLYLSDRTKVAAYAWEKGLVKKGS